MDHLLIRPTFPHVSGKKSRQSVFCVPLAGAIPWVGEEGAGRRGGGEGRPRAGGGGAGVSLTSLPVQVLMAPVAQHPLPPCVSGSAI